MISVPHTCHKLHTSLGYKKLDSNPKLIVIIINQKLPTPYSLLPVPYFPTPYSLLPTPCSLFPYSLLPTPYSLLPISHKSILKWFSCCQINTLTCSRISALNVSLALSQTRHC
ncbi:MAG: hypothetical protein F6K50_10385 [Moorea sp. SIO3I7]|uniref:hypothetical protein n=1 Tax=Moorena sp. SIO3I8 TaxID=2607833 RepID=UPI0013C8AB5C|nr:hypothetical protein [Moorena sp. SIO3I8]NEN95919.1 hypothetical protein [Moorena sp. SIO3I7]